MVMSCDAATGATSAQKVTQTFERQADATLVLRLKNGEQIETTKEHPFYVESRGFTAAGEMGIGTSIVTRAGPSAVLASAQVRNRKATVYNFEVENTHTYFVGHSEVWVHNSCLEVGQYLGDVMSKCPFKPALQASVSEAKVAEYLALLKSNPAAVWASKAKIIIDPDGYILNGYHRIVAAELAGVPVPESAIYRTSMKATVQRSWSDVIVQP